MLLSKPVITHQTGTCITAVGGLFYQAWLPERQRAAVLLVHGYAEHSGRYVHVAQALAEHGYAVWAIDLQGHGRSAGVRAHVGRFTDFLDDVNTFYRLVRERTDGPPFLLGHSMGGLVALLYAVEHQRDLRGLALSGPLCAAASVPPALLAVSSLLSALAPTLPVSPLDSALISRDPAVVAAYRADPLVYNGKVRARLGRELITASGTALHRAAQLALPLLVLQGDADQIVSPAATQAMFDTAASPDKTIHRYPGLYHEIFNEPEQAEVIGTLIGWLDART